MFTQPGIVVAVTRPLRRRGDRGPRPRGPFVIRGVHAAGKRRSSLARVRAEAARAIDQARVERDLEMRRLAEQGLTHADIAAAVGYSCPQVNEILQGKREEYNRRRREHWRVVYGGSCVKPPMVSEGLPCALTGYPRRV